jgi:hypothetical protein
MRLIYQKDECTCGVACVAMVCGISFDEAKAFMWKKGDDYTTMGGMKRAIEHFGATCTNRLYRPSNQNFRDLKFSAVINFYPQKGQKFWMSHWAVWDFRGKQPRLLDPDKEQSGEGHEYKFGFRYFRVSVDR